MATVEITNLSDDLDNTITEKVETVSFFDPRNGVQRELELGEGNRQALESLMTEFETFVAASREVEAAKPTRKPAAKNEENAKIREWAQKNGFQIGDRGRIKAEIVEAYRAATVDSEAQANTKARADETGLESAVPTQTVTPEAQKKAEEIAADLEAACKEADRDEADGDLDDFAQFLRENMDENGMISAHTLDKGDLER